MKPKPLPQPTFEAYYEDSSKDFWVKDNRQQYMKITEVALRRMLKYAGFRPKPRRGEPLSMLDQQLLETQLDRRIFYAGSLAGYNAGVYDVEGRLILVTDSPRLIEPVEGSFALIDHMMTEMLDREVCQSGYLYGWLRIALENLRSGQRNPGQVLVLAGERECGKSLCQQIITELLGGRSARPYQFMTGTTSFNSELFGAEHLMIEDESATTLLQARRTFGGFLKQIAANNKQRHHAKNRNAITLDPFWRLSVSVNDEPENLMVLPPLDESLRDKIILLRAEKRPMPMPTSTPAQKLAFWEAIKRELPAFVHALLEFEIPDSLASPRYGITHFHHPELVGAIEELAPETQLLDWLDLHLFPFDDEPHFEGTAAQIEEELRKELKNDRQLDQLLKFRTACGSYLARLMKKLPDRISCRRSHGSSTIWKITRRK
jgi:hypothetical protein